MPRTPRGGGGGTPVGVKETAGGAGCEKYFGTPLGPQNRNLKLCALAGCETTFVPPPQAPHKRYCSERHQRTAESRRYRARHTELATCKACGSAFERTTTSKRLQVYCALDCQYQARSETYRQRLDIRENLRRARLAKG